MADDAAAADAGGGGGGGDDVAPQDVKCPECPPGLPGWMATFSDLVTLLLTFFVLLLSFAKTETAKYEAALGSIRNSFGGNVLKKGEVIQRGKSPDNSPTMMDSQEPIRPFPIEFLTTEGFLDKHEVNRESTEDLNQMKNDLYNYELSQNSEIYEVPEGIKVRIKDKILFKNKSIKVEDISVKVLDRMIKLLSKSDWTVFVEGHAAIGERINSNDGPWELSSKRALAVAKLLIKRGVSPGSVSVVFYGDSRPISTPGADAETDLKNSRRVEFIIRKRDLRENGHKVPSQ